MKRQIIRINEEKCNGCGQCVPNCPEGALQIIDGKARLISDLFCDGLGACIGTCPENAIKIEEREAEPYDEKKVMINIIKQGDNVIKAHLHHLKEHGEMNLYKQALAVLEENRINTSSFIEDRSAHHGHNCPGSQVVSQLKQKKEENPVTGTIESQLTHWPIQMHLLNPLSAHFKKSDLLLAADCTAFSLGGFHPLFLKNKTLAIACPKLDSNREVYIDKLQALMDEAEINTLTVMIMQVPCCSGLLQLAKEAQNRAKKKVPVKLIVVSLQGEILKEEWA